MYRFTCSVIKCLSGVYFLWVTNSLLRAFIYIIDFKPCFKTMASIAYLAKTAFTEMYRRGIISNRIRMEGKSIRKKIVLNKNSTCVNEAKLWKPFLKPAETVHTRFLEVAIKL